MSKVSQKTKRQILLLGVPLIMKIKSEERVNLRDLEQRLEELKSKGIVKSDYTIENLVNDTCICTNVTEIPVSKSSLSKKKSRSRKVSRSRSRSRSRSKKNKK